MKVDEKVLTSYNKRVKKLEEKGVDVDGLIADDINVSVIQEQVEMGVAVRMAAMDLLMQARSAERAKTVMA